MGIPTPDEDQRLIQAAQSGNVDARNELISRHMPFIIRTARTYCRRSAGIEVDDLVQACVLAMIRAIHKYDTDKANGRFVWYASHWLRRFMDDAIQDSQGVRVPLSTAYAHRRGEVSSGTSRAIERFRGVSQLPDGYDAAVPRSENAVEQRLQLQEAIAKLPPASQRIIHERYVCGKTLQEIGLIVGRTKECVRQRLQKVVAILIDECR